MSLHQSQLNNKYSNIKQWGGSFFLNECGIVVCQGRQESIEIKGLRFFIDVDNLLQVMDRYFG